MGVILAKGLSGKLSFLHRSTDVNIKAQYIDVCIHYIAQSGLKLLTRLLKQMSSLVINIFNTNSIGLHH